MKKLVVLAVLALSISIVGCKGKSDAPAGKETKKEVETTVKKETDKETKKEEVKEEYENKEFQIDVNYYTIDTPKSWDVTISDDPNGDDVEIQMESKEDIALYVTGIPRSDYDSMENIVKIFEETLIEDEDTSTGEVDPDSVVTEDTEINGFPGKVQTMDVSLDGAKSKITIYYLESSSDYVVISVEGSPSAFKNHAETIDHVVHSISEQQQ